MTESGAATDLNRGQSILRLTYLTDAYDWSIYVCAWQIHAASLGTEPVTPVTCELSLSTLLNIDWSNMRFLVKASLRRQSEGAIREGVSNYQSPSHTSSRSSPPQKSTSRYGSFKVSSSLALPRHRRLVACCLLYLILLSGTFASPHLQSRSRSLSFHSVEIPCTSEVSA